MFFSRLEETVGRHLSLRRAVISVGMLGAVVLSGLVGFERWHARALLLEQVEEQTSVVARSLEEHATQILTSTDLLLQNITGDLNSVPSVRNIERDGLYSKLHSFDQGAVFIDNLAIMDDAGVPVVTSRTPNPLQASYADREHFRVHRDSDGIGLFIGQPVQSRSGTYTFLPLSRRISAEDGRFLGVVVTEIPVTYFERFYSSLITLPNSSIFLVFSDGRPLIHVTNNAAQKLPLSGRTFGDHPLFADLIPARAAGIYRGKGLLGNDHRIISYRSLNALPLVVLTSIGRDEVLQPWRRMTMRVVPFFALLLGVITLATAMLARYATQRERWAAEMEKAKIAADESSRAKSDFLARMSHEIRTPMNGVLGFTDVLLETKLDARQKEYVTIAHDSAQTLLTLLNDILDYSKIEVGRIDLEAIDFDPVAMTKSVVTLLRRQAENKSLNLSLAMAPGIPAVLNGDPNRLRQILINLIGNAIKFTRRGGVAVRVSSRDAGDNLTELRFEVEDSGIGISEAGQQHLFNLFSQADNSIARRFGGTGLGLAISKSLAELMGGGIGVASFEGKGSTFWFTAVLMPAMSSGVSASDRSALRQGGKAQGRVLVVDDVDINRRLVSLMLGGAGYDVEVAPGGRQALDRLGAGDIDLVLLDLHMPDMDGFETVMRIRAMSGAVAGVPVLAMTADAMAGVIERCLSAGMNGYVSKPVVKEDLLAAIAVAMAKQGSGAPTAPPLPPASSPSGPDSHIDHGVLDELEKQVGRAQVVLCVRLFHDQLTRTVRQISDRARVGDCDEIAIHAHALASPAGGLGLVGVGALCREMMSCAREDGGTVAELVARADALRRAAVMALAALERRYPDVVPEEAKAASF